MLTKHARQLGIAIIAAALLIGAGYVVGHIARPNALPGISGISASTTIVVPSEATSTPFKLDFENSAHMVSGAFVPMSVSTSWFPPLGYPTDAPDAPSITMSLTPLGTTTSAYTLEFVQGSSYPPQLYLPVTLPNGTYRVEASTTYPSVFLCCSKPTTPEDRAAYEALAASQPPQALLYRTSLVVARSFSDPSLADVVQLYPNDGKTWKLVDTDGLELDKPEPLLSFSIGNRSGTPIRIQALHIQGSISNLFDSTSGKLDYLKQLSLYDLDAKQDLGALILTPYALQDHYSRLFSTDYYTTQYREDAASDRIYYLDTPIEVPPGGTRKLVLFGLMDKKYLENDTSYYGIGGYYEIDVSELIGEQDGSVFVKETPNLKTGIVSSSHMYRAASTTPTS